MAPLTEVLGWALLHSIWQGALVALLVWGALRAFRRTAPRVRYGVGLVGLCALLALPAVTYHQTVELWTGQRAWLVDTADRILRADLAERGRASVDDVKAELRRRHAAAWPADRGLMGRLAEEGRDLAVSLAWVWMGGVVVLFGRLGVQWRRARRLAGAGEADERWRALSWRIASRMAVSSPVRIRVSDRVDVPALIGWRWPVILVPPEARALPDDVVEAILAHELAHVRRHDYLVTVLQAIADTLLFYNPAAWWISARVREERECCCDQSAIPVVDGGASRYLRALVSLETRRPAATGALALTGGPLLRRIRRVHEWARDRRRVSWADATALVLVVSAAFAFVPPERATLAARVSATSLALRDLDGLRLVAWSVGPPGPRLRPPPLRMACPAAAGREV